MNKNNAGVSKEEEHVIATENRETIEWIEEKILSVISYYNETKGIFSSVDDI